MKKHVSRVLKDYREKRGMTIQQLMDTTGLSRNTVYRYENGKLEKIPIGPTFEIADALDIPLDYLYNAHLLDGVNKYHYDILVEEMQKRGWSTEDKDFFSRYSTDYVQKNLKEVDTPYMDIAQLYNAMDLGVLMDDEPDDLQNLIESLCVEEREKAYNILKQVFDQ